MYFVVLVSALVACAAGVPVNSTKPKPEGRVYGGTDAEIKDFSWQLSLWLRTSGCMSHLCGAVLIKEGWALTAAHCVKGMSLTSLRVRAGSATPRQVWTATIFVVENVTIHEDFNKTMFNDFDIAVLKLGKSISMNPDSIVPRTIELQDYEVKPGTEVVVTGWGWTLRSYFSTTLQRATLHTISNEDCMQTYPGKISENMICAKGEDRDACQGDSGGPLVDLNNHKLVGLVSWGQDCKDPKNMLDVAGVYTRIFSLYNWINDQIPA